MVNIIIIIEWKQHIKIWEASNSHTKDVQCGWHYLVPVTIQYLRTLFDLHGGHIAGTNHFLASCTYLCSYLMFNTSGALGYYIGHCRWEYLECRYSLLNAFHYSASLICLPLDDSHQYYNRSWIVLTIYRKSEGKDTVCALCDLISMIIMHESLKLSYTCMVMTI